MELVVGSGMVEVMDQGGDQTGKHLQVSQPVLENSKFKSYIDGKAQMKSIHLRKIDLRFSLVSNSFANS